MLVVRKFSNDHKYYMEVSTQDEAYNPLQESEWDGHISLCSRYSAYGTEYGTRDYLNVDEFSGYAHIRFESIRGGVRIPVYAYEHSGVVFSTSNFNDPWDSGLVGWAWMEASRVKEIFNGNKDKARDYLRCMIKTLNAYAGGDVFSYAVYETATGDILDSCGDCLCLDSWSDFMKELADMAQFKEIATAQIYDIDDID